jgi:hypothetical protein
VVIGAFSGHKESGKTTCADWLVEKGGWKRLSFAAPLRQEVADAGFPGGMVFGKPTTPEMRRLLQAWGDVRRAQDTNYFVDIMLDNMASYIQEGFNVVIDDLRYINEAEALQQEGAVLVRIKKIVHHKPGDAHVCSCKGSAEAHQSEHDLDGYVGFDYYLEAIDGDLGGLKARLMAIVEREIKLPGGVL